MFTKIGLFTVLIAMQCTQIVLTQQPQPIKEFEPHQFNVAHYEQFGHKKRIPPEIRQQALIALSYFPKLKNERIRFRLRKRKTPLTSRPRVLSALLPRGLRSYVITISTQTNSRLAPILFHNLPYNAQIGVLGHEIAHIPYYHNRSTLQLLGLGFKLGNNAFVDQFEFDTDKATIGHGLGNQLLEWSIYVRKALNIKSWMGASENLQTGNLTKPNQRYMNPETIRHFMDLNELYQNQ